MGNGCFTLKENKKEDNRTTEYKYNKEHKKTVHKGEIISESYDLKEDRYDKVDVHGDNVVKSGPIYFAKQEVESKIKEHQDMKAMGMGKKNEEGMDVVVE